MSTHRHPFRYLLTKLFNQKEVYQSESGFACAIRALRWSRRIGNSTLSTQISCRDRDLVMEERITYE